MPRLVPPEPRVRASFDAAMDEFAAEGRGSATDRTVIGSYLRDHAGEGTDEPGFEAFCAAVRAQGARVDAASCRLGTGDRALVGRG